MTHTEPLRTCKTCGIEAYTKDELNLYVKEISCKHGRAPLCYSCNRKRAAKWEEKNRDTSRQRKLDSRARRIYKITYEEYMERMATSDCCEVCGNKENLGYDHCHDTMKFRGVLCNKCNRSIGQLGDTKEAIKRVLNYLER